MSIREDDLIEDLKAELTAKTAECERLRLAYETENQAATTYARQVAYWIEKHDKLLAERKELEAQEPVGEVDGFGSVWWKDRPPQGTKLYISPRPVPAVPLVPCPICGGEAVGKQDVLARVVIGAAPAVPEGYRLVPEKLPDDTHCGAGVDPCVCATVTLLDAARYRALRNQDIEKNFPRSGLFIGRIPDNKCLTHEHADIAVDAMLAAAPKEPT